MSKSLEELKRLAYENACRYCQYYIDKKCTNEGECVWKTIEQELKDYYELKDKLGITDVTKADYFKMFDQSRAWEIVKNKAVNLYYIEIVNNYINYNRCIDEFFGNYEHRDIYYLTKEEFDLIKGDLKYADL